MLYNKLENNMESFAAPAVHDTWEKKGYLFSNRLFVITFMYFNEPAYTACMIPEDDMQKIHDGKLKIKWGKGFQNAFSDYQTFKSTGETSSFTDTEFKEFVEKITEDRKLVQKGTSGMLKHSTPVGALLNVVESHRKYDMKKK